MPQSFNRIWIYALWGTKSRKPLIEPAAENETGSKPKQTKHMEKGGSVYIMCSLNHRTLYVGVTSNLPSRVMQHKEKFYPNSFSAKYNYIKLVYYKWFDTIMEAIAEEKRIKGGSRKKKNSSSV